MPHVHHQATIRKQVDCWLMDPVSLSAGTHTPRVHHRGCTDPGDWESKSKFLGTRLKSVPWPGEAKEPTNAANGLSCYIF